MNKRDMGATVLIVAGVAAASLGATLLGGAGGGLLAFGITTYVLGALLGMI